MIRKILASAVIFIVLWSTFAYASDYSYSAGVENGGSHKYKAVRLTPDIYNKINFNMMDIEIFNSNNEPVPYFVNSFSESGTESKKTYEMALVNSFVKDEYFYYDYALKNTLNEDVTATSMEVQTGVTAFAKKLEVYGGYDNVNWEKVQDDILYNVDGNKKLEIAFNGVKKYTFYRFKIANNLEKISFSNVLLKYNKTLQKRDYFVNTITPKFTTEEKDNKTIVKIEGLKNLKLNSITLKTDSVFKRNVTFSGGASKVLYNLNFSNTNYKDLTISLGQHRVATDFSEIIIDNKDDKPISISGIEAGFLADELVFEGVSSGEYKIRFGNNEIRTPKSYDISNYKDLIINEGYDLLSIKEIETVPVKAAPPETHIDYKLIFNVVITLVALIMGWIVLLKLKKTEK